MHNGGRENIKLKVCLNTSLTSVHITAFVSPVSSRWFSQNLLHKESRKNGSVPTAPTALSYGLGQAPTLFVLELPASKVASIIFFKLFT